MSGGHGVRDGISKALRAALGHHLRETGTALQKLGAGELYTKHRPKMIFGGKMPFKTNDTFIAPNAQVIGDVTNWDRSSVWYNAVARADSGYPIEIGYCSSIGDGSVLCTLPPGHMLQTGFEPECFVGHYVIVGSGCVLKSCRIDDMTVIGDKCTIMEGSIIENNVILESGTIIPAYSRIPSGQVWGGNPARYIRELSASEKDAEKCKDDCKSIHGVAYEHMVELLPYGHSYLHLEELSEKNQKEQEETLEKMEARKAEVQQ